MPINNYNELKDQVLDKQNTLLSRAEVNKLNQVTSSDYKSMTNDIASHSITWKGKSTTVKDLVDRMDPSTGKVDGVGTIKWGSELGAWVQVFLISRGESLYNDHVGGNMSIDGKIGEQSRQALSNYKLARKVSTNTNKIDKNSKKIDALEIQKINNRLQGAREYSKGWQNPLKVRIIDNKNPFKISISNYGKTSVVDLSRGTIQFAGRTFQWPTSYVMEKVGDKVNISSSTKNTTLLKGIYKQAGLLNKVFGDVDTVAKKEGLSKNPFHVSGGVSSSGVLSRGIEFDDSYINDTAIISESALYKSSKYNHRGKDWGGYGPGFSAHKMVDILNTIYQVL